MLYGDRSQPTKCAIIAEWEWGRWSLVFSWRNLITKLPPNRLELRHAPNIARGCVLWRRGDAWGHLDGYSSCTGTATTNSATRPAALLPQVKYCRHSCLKLLSGTTLDAKGFVKLVDPLLML